MKSIVTKAFLILVLFASGCSAQNQKSNASGWRGSNNPVKESSFSENISWDSYRQLYSVPEMEISNIVIDYDYSGWNFDSRRYEITLSSGMYKTHDSLIVDKDKVRNFGGAFINLRLSGGTKNCVDHTDDYPSFRITIEYKNGEKVVLYSSSNCTLNRTPWNVVYDGNLYFQSTGEIPGALYTLLASFDQGIKDWWQPELVAATYTDAGSNFSLISLDHPPEIDSPIFSEDILFREHLLKSNVLVAYLKKFDLGKIDLQCSLQTDCSEINSQVELIGKSNTVFLLNVLFSGDDVVVLNPVPAAQLATVAKRLLSHPFIKMANRAIPEDELDINCWKETECSSKDWCASGFNVLGKTPRSVELVCSVMFKVEYRNSLVLFPDDGLFWVQSFIYDLDNTKAEKNNLVVYPEWNPDMTGLVDLFNTKKYPSFVDDHGNAISVGVKNGTCNSIGLSYDYATIRAAEAKNPAFMFDLERQLYNKTSRGRVSIFANWVSILGYCVYISPDGEFVLYEP